MSNPTEQSLPPVAQAATIQLKRLIKFGDQTVSVLELREPTAGDLRQLGSLQGGLSNPARMALELAAVQTGLPDKVLDRLGLEDLGEVVKFLAPFVLAFVSAAEAS